MNAPWQHQRVKRWRWRASSWWRYRAKTQARRAWNELRLLRPDAWLDITQADIDAVGTDAGWCPADVAAKRMFGRVSTGSSFIFEMSAPGVAMVEWYGGKRLYAFTRKWDSEKVAVPTRIPLVRKALKPIVATPV